jgi:DNA polymerase-3 subunit gamma/tau
LNESEIQFKAARNKRLHVEMALIKLCYLGQALQISATENGVETQKLAGKSRTLSFKNITPISIKPAKAATIVPEPVVQQKLVPQAPKLIIETKAEKPAPKTEPFVPALPANPPKANTKKLSSLEAIRQQVDAANGNAVKVDQPLETESLQAAWAQFIETLKENKNPAWQSFQLADLIIKDQNSFEATASNNLQQKFLEIERNKACEFLQKELQNRSLQFSIILIEGPQENNLQDLPLSSREQYLKLVEQYPLVQELKDRLRLDLDY